MKRLFLSSVLFVAMFQCPSMADNWAHWRGPTGNGVATNAQPPVQWGSTKNVKWKVAIPGRGSGTPVIWEQRVFVVTAVPVDNGGDAVGLPKLAFKILCFDRSNGRQLWDRTATVATPHEQIQITNTFASASPCTDGKHVYAHFGSRGLYCYTMDGELRWKRNDFGQMETRSSFGEGSSPTLAGDKILVPWDHEGQSYLYALDKSNGETIWKTERDEPTCWATPLVVEHNGAKQVVMNGQTCARAYELETGTELWRCGGQAQRPVASAVAGNGLVFIGSGFMGSFLGAFRLDGQGDIENTEHVAWVLDRDTPDIASPLLSGGRLYFHKAKTGMLSCVDAATGKPHYTAARIGLTSTYASPIAAGGHVYLTGRSGTTVVIEESDELKIVASNSVGETVDATPAPVDNELFIRGENHLFCIAAPSAGEDTARQTKKHLFILSGQSNMQGHRPEEAFTPAVQAAFGSENVIVVQHALGGQPIQRWYKKWKSPAGESPETTGDLYDELMEKIRAKTSGREIATISFFWMQGERDAKMGWGAVYRESLEGLIEQLGDDLGRDDLNVVIGRLSDFDMKNAKYPQWTMVREAQVKVVEKHPSAAWIDTDDLNDGVNRRGAQIKDDLHYSAEGYKIFGKRMADAAIELIRTRNK